MLLHRLRRGGAEGNKELLKRIHLFDQGHWHQLLDLARSTLPRSKRRPALEPGSSEDWLQRLKKVHELIIKGELSNAARLIKSNGLAPGDENTYAQLINPDLRPQLQQDPIPLSDGPRRK